MFCRYKFLSSIFITSLFALSVAYSAAPAEIERQTISLEEMKGEDGKIDINKVSEAFGHLIGKNLESLGFEFDMTQVIRGIEDSVAGKDSPMNETECVQAISIVQEEAFQTLAQRNLDAANQFMSQNSKNKGVVEIEKSMLQYRVEKSGEGVAVEAHYSPMIRFTGSFLDGKVFGSSEEDELISLDETISGFSQGIIGMREGEKRTIYIHPDLGYGTSGYLPPNSLLVFEIELVKANAKHEQEDSLSSIPEDGLREIATPNGSSEKEVR
ncbi:MAG: putative FKBP-type peptidyl-prolyl cis-trans isomerase [Chlamydiae bacterium]|nr:putative FKBP-type peptidyl-prolyl cis-trans isomerase [Chlamydiota bacterium]